MSDGGSLTPGSARSLLQTILGEMVWPSGTEVWTSTLVHVLGGLGIEEQTARQAIARAAAQGWIEPQRRGREVQWSLSLRLAQIFDSGSRRVLSLSDPFAEWDGNWLALLVTIPASRRQARRPLYAGLTWAGFGNPAPGLWLTPHVERREEVRRLIDQVDLSAHTLALVGSVDAIGVDQATIVEQGWDLAGLAAHYDEMLKRMADLDPAPGDDTLFAFLRMVSEWQGLPWTDPQLPEALLPDWVGRRVARRIEELRKQWTPEARRRFAELDSARAIEA